MSDCHWSRNRRIASGLFGADWRLASGIVIEGAKVTVQMTLTTAGCPMQESLAWGVQSALLSLEGVEDVEVELVWDPPWSPDRMTAEGRARLGVR